jgi:hypothetical protein
VLVDILYNDFGDFLMLLAVVDDLRAVEEGRPAFDGQDCNGMAQLLTWRVMRDIPFEELSKNLPQLLHIVSLGAVVRRKLLLISVVGE